MGAILIGIKKSTGFCYRSIKGSISPSGAIAFLPHRLGFWLGWLIGGRGRAGSCGDAFGDRIGIDEFAQTAWAGVHDEIQVIEFLLRFGNVSRARQIFDDKDFFADFLGVL